MAGATLIDGKTVAADLRQRVADAVASLHRQHRVRPGLATILIGDDPASTVYIRSKTRACNAAEIASFHYQLPNSASERDLLDLIAALNADDRVDGILVQLPVPAHIDTRQVLAAIDPAKDVDGFHPLNVGRLWSGEAALIPCTPQGCLILLRSVCPDLSGANAVVVGRSTIVGRPIAALLLAEHCTVTMAHSRSVDLAAICSRADILIAAVGRPLMIKANWIKRGAIVIDVGINRIVEQQERGVGTLVGDVDFAEACSVAGAITPVPGGVGPMTIACLLRNTLLAACRRRGLPDPVPLLL
jgi:methylenetetrahydrofolate dehydrogenase (NADP+)/methenyltetrahydrofolate cyclohydrolase